MSDGIETLFLESFFLRERYLSFPILVSHRFFILSPLAGLATDADEQMDNITAPTLKISGLPDTLNDSCTRQITFTFSEPVTGFDFSDIRQIGGIMVSQEGFFGSGTTYQIQFSALWGRDVSITVPALSFVVADRVFLEDRRRSNIAFQRPRNSAAQLLSGSVDQQVGLVTPIPHSGCCDVPADGTHLT